MNELQLRLSTIDRQLHSLTAAAVAQPGTNEASGTGALADTSAASATSAVSGTQAALRGLVEGKNALEAQVQELTQRCSGLGATNEELRCTVTTQQSIIPQQVFRCC